MEASALLPVIRVRGGGGTALLSELVKGVRGLVSRGATGRSSRKCRASYFSARGRIGLLSKSARANAAALWQAYVVQSGCRLKPTTSLIPRIARNGTRPCAAL